MKSFHKNIQLVIGVSILVIKEFIKYLLNFQYSREGKSLEGRQVG